jgi:hypothetical protein
MEVERDFQASSTQVAGIKQLKTKLDSQAKSYGSIESHQYEQEESEIWWHHQLQRYT